MKAGDSLILFVLSAVLIGLLLSALRRWLGAPIKLKRFIEPDDEVPVSDAVELLEYSGYEVFTGKRKIPIHITVNDKDELHSRLFVDHFASEDDKVYIVKLARDRKPLERTGSAIRDQLLMYYLLYEQVEGILYVDPKQRTIDKISFQVETSL